jgi:hypothetical protein
MKRLIMVATAAVFLVTLAVAVPATAGGGRHRGGGFFFGSAGFSGYPAYGGPSFFVGSISPGFSFFINSGPSYGYGRHGYGRHYRGRDGYERHRYGRREYRRYDRDRYYDRPYRRHGPRRGYSRGYGGIRPRVQNQSYGTITRQWVPGTSTPGGYAAGYWSYR